MPATIEALLRRRDLGLTLLTPNTGPATRATIRWVAASELADPTPFLRGGELVLTTGMRLPRERRATADYAARLTRVGVLGLGLGIGRELAFQSVPPRLIRAAEENGLTLLVVDEPTPFIAIGEAVAQMQLADETADLAHTVAAQQSLTRAAVLHGRAGVVKALASLIHGWSLVTDTGGTVLAHAGGTGETTVDWRAEVGRMRRELLGSAALLTAGTHVSIHALGEARAPRGYLVTGSDHRPGALQAMTAIATALLTVTMGDTREAIPAASGALTALQMLPRPRVRDTLLRTLRVWLERNGNYDATARELRVHRNTVRYRIGRIGEIIGRDLGDVAVRTDLWLALDRQAAPGAGAS